MNIGAIILCGGKSTRMGRDKATLPFGPECMLQRLARLLGEVVPQQLIVVVSAANQTLPPLPPETIFACDQHPERGPLEGLAAGLQAVPPTVDAVYVTSCDVPLLLPEFVREMFALLGDFEIVVPRDGEYHHPLAAVYRRSVLHSVHKLLAVDRLRPRFLFDKSRTREVDVEELRSVDADLQSLRNLNTPDDYRTALRCAGFGD